MRELGGGGEYSYLRVLLKSVVIMVDFKTIRRAECEDMNIHPPPPPNYRSSCSPGNNHISLATIVMCK